MSRATTRLPMLWMLTRELPSWIQRILISRLVCNCFDLAQRMAAPHLLLRRTFIRRRIRLPALVGNRGLVRPSKLSLRMHLPRIVRKGQERTGLETCRMSTRRRSRQTPTITVASHSDLLLPRLHASRHPSKISPCGRLMRLLEALLLLRVAASLLPLVISISQRRFHRP